MNNIVTAEPPTLRESYEEDEILVRECLVGNEKAWATLIRKYANLIFSIPIRRRYSQEDASDIFQAVCLAMLGALGSLRQPRALAAWLIQTTLHTCERFDARQHRLLAFEPELASVEYVQQSPETLLRQLENEQLLRQAVAHMCPECRKLIDLLFFTDPPVPYEKAAAELGMAKGSVGATRMRCLEKLRRSLEEQGFN